MAFKDDYVDTGGLSYVTTEEKDVLIAEGVVFPITNVRFDEGGGYKGKDRFLATVELEGEERALSVDAESVPTRIRLFNKLVSYFGGDEAEPVPVKIVLSPTDNRTQLFELV